MTLMPHELDLGCRPLVNEYLRRFPPQVSELTFTNLFTWRRSKPVFYIESDGTLVFLARDSNGQSRGLGPPVGPLPSTETLLTAVPDLRGFERITANLADILRAGGWTVQPDRANSDYVYRRADLAELAGGKYHKKRNLVKQCLDGHDCRYEPVKPALIPDCMALQQQWCRVHDCHLDPSLCHENDALLEALAHFSELELIGGVIRVDGRIAAFAIGERLSPDTAVCHFEKALPGILGLAQLINQWFARYALEGFEFVNREQDLGVPGLRQAKESYSPHHMVDKFIASAPGCTPSAPPLPELKPCQPA